MGFYFLVHCYCRNCVVSLVGSMGWSVTGSPVGSSTPLELLAFPAESNSTHLHWKPQNTNIAHTQVCIHTHIQECYTLHRQRTHTKLQQVLSNIQSCIIMVSLTVSLSRKRTRALYQLLSSLKSAEQNTPGCKSLTLGITAWLLSCNVPVSLIIDRDTHLEMAGFKYHYANTLSQTVTHTLKWLVLSTITLIPYHRS